MHVQLSKLVILVAVVLTGLAGLGPVAAHAEGKTGAGPHYPLPKGAKKCIRDTAFMRRNHMKLLLHKRDLTMHQGIRTKDASLKECVSCHAAKDATGKAIPVNAPGQFCASCHEYAAVSITCFECHRTTPEKPAGQAGLTGFPGHSGKVAQNVPDGEQLRRYLQEVKK